MEVKLPDAYDLTWNGWSVVLCRSTADQLGLVGWVL